MEFSNLSTAHDAGLVKLQVALNGTVISHAVIFEYKNASKRLEEELELSAELLTIVEESTNNSTNNTFISDEIIISEQQQDQQEPKDNITTNTILNPANNIREPHNLYLCHDVSCQRILKTMLLQKLEDLIFNMDDPQKRQSSSLNLQCRSPRYVTTYRCMISNFLMMI